MRFEEMENRAGRRARRFRSPKVTFDMQPEQLAELAAAAERAAGSAEALRDVFRGIAGQKTSEAWMHGRRAAMMGVVAGEVPAVQDGGGG